LRSLQEIQSDFEEEAKAYAGLWSQGKKEEELENWVSIAVFSIEHTISIQTVKKFPSLRTWRSTTSTKKSRC
jgi:hypothetical protein